MEFTTKLTDNNFDVASDCLVIPLYESTKLEKLLTGLEDTQKQTILQLDAAGDISRKAGQTTLIHCQQLAAKRLLFIGCGKSSDFAELRESITSVYQALTKLPVKHASIVADTWYVEYIEYAQLLQQVATLFTTRSYQYDHTLSKKADGVKLEKISMLSTNPLPTDYALERGQAIGKGINTAKHLGNLPPNICTPSFLAETASNLSKQHKNLMVTVLDEAELKNIGMHSLLSVSAGSDQPAKVAIMHYKGAADSERPYVLVGKGVTFDSGGISIKPGAKMDEMKFDMCGAASVIGTMQTACELNLPLNIIGVIGAVENMPSGRATKPGDVINTLSGQTVEVLNTDAEGRLVLCDLLTYVERFNPETVVDIATLTGACVVALGNHTSGLFTDDIELSYHLLEAGQYTYDRAWPMPLWKEYDKQLESNFADMGNIGGPGAGSVTAACFLARFTKNYTWAHLDIAGTAWLEGKEKGATGRPVSLLSQYLIDRCDY